MKLLINGSWASLGVVNCEDGTTVFVARDEQKHDRVKPLFAFTDDGRMLNEFQLDKALEKP